MTAGAGGRKGKGGAILATVALVCVVPQAGFAADVDPRAALKAALVEQNRGELAHDPSVVAEKLRKMARGSFDFYRGAIGLYPEPPSTFLGGPQVALIGDPHPENVGTFAPGDGQIIVDFNDFDRAHFGPFVEDVRRLALGVALAAGGSARRKKTERHLVEAVVDGYVAEIGRVNRKEGVFGLRADTAFGGKLASILDHPSPAFSDKESLVGRDELAKLGDALEVARGSLVDGKRFAAGFFSVKRAAHAHRGVASFAVDRIRIEVEGPSPAPDDDVAIELKETPAAKIAEIIRLERALKERADEDPLLGPVRVGDKSYRMRSFGPSRRRISVERLAAALGVSEKAKAREPEQAPAAEWKKKDLKLFAEELGRLLGRAHARAPGMDGKPVSEALARAVRDGEALKDETVAATKAAVRIIERDVAVLHKLVRDREPSLGFAPAAR